MEVYSVGQIITYIRDLLEEDSKFQDIWVSGEVANLSRPVSGHSYFSLREANTSLRCVMFRNARGAERLDEGESVLAHGRVSIYEARGDLQVIVDIVQPQGVGELQLKLEQLKLKLEKAGFFEPSRKRELPDFARCLGVITSPTGAVWQDIQTVIGRRYPLVKLVLVPVSVQGKSASSEIAEAFRIVNEAVDLDLVILARGGGSLEDLWPFNEEAVAEAIFSSRAPVITGIGHETDFTIADMVADQRAPTPSVAAEMAVPDRSDLETRLLLSKQILDASISKYLSNRIDSLNHLEAILQRHQPDLDATRIHIDDLLQNAATHIIHNLNLGVERLGGVRMRLDSLSPQDTLRRGYAIVQKQENEEVVSDVDQVSSGDGVRVTVNKGAFGATVVSTGGPDDG